MKDLTDGKLEETLEFAKTINDGSLKECLENLERAERNMFANTGRTVETFISNDWAAKSFYFSRQYADGTFAGNGGIIWHGKHDNGGDGSSSTFSVCLTPVNGWSIHT